jgi:TolB-like protein/class 3 adenylate cyclase
LTGDNVQRRLAAVLAADVAGYSRLMGVDEEGTLARLKAVRKALVDPTISKHRGRIVKTTGDGMLVEFASAVDAVRGAVEIQREMAEQNASVPQDKRIELRIGIHVGDIIIDDNDIFGDGVNIAARLEGICEPGGVCMSNDAYRQVRGKVEIVGDDMGPQPLKNIAEPMQAWRVRLMGQIASAVQSGSTTSEPQPLPLPDKPSIAVLPFQNMSGDAEQEYFADGVVEDIITALSRFKSLFVIARNSSFAYKGKSPDIRQVGRDLGVRYVLEGSVRKGGNRLRITAQLIDAQSGAHVWADRFEGSPEDIFEFQDGVTEKVVAAIAPRLERAEMARASRRPPGNADAYDCYLKGLACLSAQLSPQRIAEALDLFSQASALDPDFASAYGLAMECHAYRLGFGLAKDLAQERNEILRLWQIVERVGTDDGRALAATAWTVAYILRDLSSAKRLIDKAVELNPNLSKIWEDGGWISIWLGAPETALQQLSRARRLDPASEMTSMPMAHALFFLDRYEEALDEATHMLRRHPDGHGALRIGAASAAFAGQAALARQLASHLLEVDPAFVVSRLSEYLGPYQRTEFVVKYAEGLHRAGLPQISAINSE